MEILRRVLFLANHSSQLTDSEETFSDSRSFFSFHGKSLSDQLGAEYIVYMNSELMCRFGMCLQYYHSCISPTTPVSNMAAWNRFGGCSLVISNFSYRELGRFPNCTIFVMPALGIQSPYTCQL